ncbi:MAG: hypothetical protein GY953_45640, partial [bacterium]|nr:hypothetical protein [bacterium]
MITAAPPCFPQQTPNPSRQLPAFFVDRPGHGITGTSTGLRATFLPGEVVYERDGRLLTLCCLQSRQAEPELTEPLGGQANFLLGNNPLRWITGRPLYGGVIYRDLYAGIDLVYRGGEMRLKSEFLVEPGGDPAAIRMVYEGTEAVRLEANGDLVLVTAGGEVREAAPAIYQIVNGEKASVAGSYEIYPDS